MTTSQIELYVDGGARGNPGPAACAFVIKEADGPTLEAKGIYLGRATNNVAEYTGLIHGLEAARAMGVKELDVFSDSELMVRQIIGEYRVKSKDLLGLFEQVQRLLLSFDRWKIQHVPREANAEADRLVNETLDAGGNGAARASKTAKPAPPAKKPPKLQAPAEPFPLVAPQAAPADADVKILVKVVTGADETHCPALMKRGQCFVFTEFIPAGVCIHAAQSLLPTVIALRSDPAFKGAGLMVKCSHPGCGAGFEVSLL